MSTTTNLTVFHSLLLEYVESESQVHVIYTDLNKAFDSINHSVLLKKLKHIGVLDPLFSWINSYLSFRSQVKIYNYCSVTFPVTYDVLQGGHLPPCLFNVSINGVNKCFPSCNFLLFADDSKIIKIINNISDCVSLQNSLCPSHFLGLVLPLFFIIVYSQT